MKSERNALLNELYSLYKDASLEEDGASSLEYMYEIALLKEGRFESEEASSIYTGILLVLQNSKATRESSRLRARSLTRLGSIRRDQGRVLGIEGAIKIYLQALQLWKSLNDKQKIAQVTWYLGACNEMQKNYKQALEYYSNALKIESIDESLKGAILIRIGTVLTKVSEFDIAKKVLNHGIGLVERGMDFGYYIYGKQKLAITIADEGKLEKALYVVSDSMPQIPETHKFRYVQSKTLFADLMFRSGELNAALEAIKEAEEIAQKYSFGHQLSSIHSILNKHLNKKALAASKKNTSDNQE